LVFTQEIGGGETKTQVLDMGVKAAPAGGIDKGWITIRDFVVTHIKSGIRVAVLEKEIATVFSGAPIDGYKVFKFWHDLIPFRELN
jgi:hypothetical protein